MLDDVNKPFVFKSLLTTPNNVLSLHLKQTFLPIIWIFTVGEGNGINSRLPFEIFSTLNEALEFSASICKWWQWIQSFRTYSEIWFSVVHSTGFLSCIFFLSEENQFNIFEGWLYNKIVNVSWLGSFFFPFNSCKSHILEFKGKCILNFFYIFSLWSLDYPFSMILQDFHRVGSLKLNLTLGRFLFRLKSNKSQLSEF